MKRINKITHEHIDQVAKIMADLDFRQVDLAQYCIRGIMSEMDVVERTAIRLYRATIESEIVIQTTEIRQEKDPLGVWGSCGSRMNNVYTKWIYNENVL